MSDPQAGQRHCDQCFRWFPKTDRHHSIVEWNFPLADGKTVSLEIILCSNHCLELWKKDVATSVAHQVEPK